MLAKDLAALRICRLEYQDGTDFGIIDLKATLTDSSSIQGGSKLCDKSVAIPISLKRIEVTFEDTEEWIIYIKFIA